MPKGPPPATPLFDASVPRIAVVIMAQRATVPAPIDHGVLTASTYHRRLMANLINVERASVSYGTRTLLDAVSLGVDEGDAIGVVGRNGDGKTTLLEVLTGARGPDSGRVTHTSGLSVGYLRQSDDFAAGATVREVIVGGRPDHIWGAAPDTDVEVMGWLARHLSGLRSKALVVVSHDRWFLDAVCTGTWEVHNGTVDAYEGGYAAYVLARAERMRLTGGAEARRRNLMRKELAWLRRGPPARTSKPRFRIQAANELIANEPPPRDSLVLQRFATTRLGKDVFDLHRLRLEVGGPPRPIPVRVALCNLPGGAVGLVGVNGTGKTSVLRLLAGGLQPAAGTIKRGTTLRIGYLSQALTEMTGAERVIDAIEDRRRIAELAGGRENSGATPPEGFGVTREQLAA